MTAAKNHSSNYNNSPKVHAWLRNKVAGRPYVLLSLDVASVPGLHPPLRAVKSDEDLGNRSDTLVVVYSSKPAQRRDAWIENAIESIIHDRGGARAQNTMLLAVTYASETLRGHWRISGLIGADIAMVPALKPGTKAYIAHQLGILVRDSTQYAAMERPLHPTWVTPIRPDKLQQVQDMLRAYERAPGSVTPGVKKEVDAARKLVRDTRAVSAGKVFGRYPKKRNITGLLRTWADSSSRRVLNLRRSNQMGHTVASNAAKRLDAALQLHMTKFALRAPHMPPKARNMRTGSEFPTLFRGIRVPRAKLDRFLKLGYSTDKAWMAFSRDAEYAESAPFGSEDDQLVVYQLSTKDVERGTPWIWFHGRATDTRNKAYVHSGVRQEEEVLLPPGVLVFKAVRRYDYKIAITVSYSRASDTMKNSSFIFRNNTTSTN